MTVDAYRLPRGYRSVEACGSHDMRPGLLVAIANSTKILGTKLTPMLKSVNYQVLEVNSRATRTLYDLCRYSLRATKSRRARANP